MRPDLSEMEFHQLFVSPVHRVRYSIEELVKMFESRIETLTTYICENELTPTSYKSTKSEVFKSLDGLNIACECLLKNLKESIESSFEKIEKCEIDSK